MYTVTFLCTSLGNNLEISLLFLMFGWNRDRKHDYVNPVPAKLRHLAALRGKTLFRTLASSRFVSCKISVIWSHCKSSCSWHLCVGGGRKVLLRSASLSSFFVYMYSRCLHSWNPRWRGGTLLRSLGERPVRIIVHSIAYHVWCRLAGRDVCGCCQPCFYAVF